MSDITELVRDDHRRIGRLADAVAGTARAAATSGCGGLASTWGRLATLAEAHTLAVHEVCWPVMADGSLRGRDLAAGLAADAADLRDAIGTAQLHPPGSRCWWLAASDALRCCGALLDREETGLLPGLTRLPAGLRDQLGRQWQAFMAAHRAESTPAPASKVPPTRPGGGRRRRGQGGSRALARMDSEVLTGPGQQLDPPARARRGAVPPGPQQDGT